ncbi:MAG: hypothetical protein AAGH78_15545 [Cyanobacteria bacterium P01_H01_bin.58]
MQLHQYSFDGPKRLALHSTILLMSLAMTGCLAFIPTSSSDTDDDADAQPAVLTETAPDSRPSTSVEPDDDAPASRIYSKTLDLRNSSAGLEQIDINVPEWQRVRVDRHDSNKIQATFTIVSESSALINAINSTDLAKNKVRETLQIDLDYDGSCSFYRFQDGAVQAASEICLQSVEVLLPADSNIDVYAINGDAPQPQLIWDGDRAGGSAPSSPGLQVN